MVFSGFVSGMHHARSRLVDMQECINWYPEYANKDSKNAISLVPTPGCLLAWEIEDNPYIRCLFGTSIGRAFTVSGDCLYELYKDGSYDLRGRIKTYDGVINMADNGVELIIVDGIYGYIYSFESNTLEMITSEGFPGNCSHVQFINGRFIVNKNDSNQFNLYWSDLFDGKTWSGAVASAEGYADKLLSIEKANNQLWLFGELSTEVFYDTGDSDRPYQRIQGAFFDNGTSAPYSTASNGNTVFWIGSNAQGSGIVWASTGYIPQRISTHAIEYIIGSMKRIDDAIGYCYQQEGHVFYVLTFPTGNRTLVYDVSTEMWHERSLYNNKSFSNERHIGNCCGFAFGKVYVGSRKSGGKIYELSRTTYTDDGTLIRRVRTSPHVHGENKQYNYLSFELDIEKGVGLNDGQGSTPDIMMQYSNDGGYTWSNEIWKTAGQIGKYSCRVKWLRLGMARDRVFRVVYSDPVPCTIVNAFLGI